MNPGREELARLAEAKATLRELVATHGRTERCPLPEADGRVLAADVVARRDVPHYDRAAMDGYAVRASDTLDATERSPVVLEGTDGPVTAGTARPVHTGSAIPDGADAVVRIERADAGDQGVLVSDVVPEGKDVAVAGEDVEAGETLFEAGHRLTPSDTALLRSTGVGDVTVAERPRVAVVPTGGELVDADVDPAPGEAVETNGMVVSRLVERWGGEPSYRDVVPDEEDALRAAIEGATDHDVVVTTGGSSVGERDLLPDVVEDSGELLVHEVAIKPGHPVGFGRVDGTPVLVLPGYPVSCLIGAVQFLRPAIAWATGTEPAELPSRRGRLTEPLPSTPGTRTFARVRFVDEIEDGDESDETNPRTAEYPGVELVRASGAGVLSSVTAADGWVEVPESRADIPVGEIVTVQKWEGVR